MTIMLDKYFAQLQYVISNNNSFSQKQKIFHMSFRLVILYKDQKD